HCRYSTVVIFNFSPLRASNSRRHVFRIGLMKALTFILAAVVGLGFVGTAHADRWDSAGWVKLGERTVNGRYDHDKIDVGAYEGRFSKLTLYVERSEMELLDFEITFGNGERFHPEVHHFFREGTRTRVVDLPGDLRV